jgi:probable phosphoglycerate mutase
MDTTERAATIFGILRHGRTDWNDARRIQGQTDTALNARGRTQAAQWARALAGRGWTRVVSSDLSRAVETASAIARALGCAPPEADPRLREQDWGQWTGSVVRELRAARPGEVERLEALGWGFAPPGGEARGEVLSRALAALADLHQRHPGERVLVVCHKGVRMVLGYHLHGLDPLPGIPDPLQGYSLLLAAHDGQALRPLEANAPMDTSLPPFVTTTATSRREGGGPCA